MTANQDYIKQRTSELYDSLPMDLEERKSKLDVRDEIIQLNYTFFGYVANSTYVDNTTYEDKFQTALMSFLGMWWKYKWTPKYRADLSFAVFFKPRISEEIRRYLAPVQYSVKRTLCLKASAQLGKPWTEVSYDDLINVKLPPDEMIALKAVLGAPYPTDLADVELYLEAPEHHRSIEDYQTTKYDSLEELLIQDMIEQESMITESRMKYLSDLYTLDLNELRSVSGKAIETLHKRLLENT